MLFVWDLQNLRGSLLESAELKIAVRGTSVCDELTVNSADILVAFRSRMQGGPSHSGSGLPEAIPYFGF